MKCRENLKILHLELQIPMNLKVHVKQPNTSTIVLGQCLFLSIVVLKVTAFIKLKIHFTKII